jgi:hypothetical protein
MARKASALASNTSATPGVLPPSTLAAQILRDKAVTGTQRSDNFEKLLTDFLNDPVVDANPGKLHENARFVTFLAEAVSEYRLRNEPFTPNQGREQASHCLRAIQITVERHPDLLLYNDEDCSTSGSQPPLLLWMLAKLLSLAAKENANGLWNQIVELLTAILHCFRKRNGSVDAAVSLSILLQSTVESKIFIPRSNIFTFLLLQTRFGLWRNSQASRKGAISRLHFLAWTF